MSIYLKDKALVPYHGDNRPLNVYRGGKKLAGWHDEERSGDGPHEWDDTYNDRVSGEIHGNGDLQSEYYSFERDSEQVSGVSATNLVTNSSLIDTDNDGLADGWGSLTTVNFTEPRNENGTQYWMPLIASAWSSSLERPGSQYINGHIYFISVRHSNVGNVVLFGNPSGSQNKRLTEAQIFAGHASFVITCTLDTTQKGRLNFYANTGLTEAWITKPICIDLTAAFGAGNEPTAEQMDAILTKFPNSWFDGTALLTTDPTYTPNTPSPDYPSPIQSTKNLIPVPIQDYPTTSNAGGRLLITKNENGVRVDSTYEELVDTAFVLKSPYFSLPPNRQVTVSFYAYIHCSHFTHFDTDRIGTYGYKLESESGVFYTSPRIYTNSQDEWKQYSFTITTGSETSYRVCMGGDSPNIHGLGNYIILKDVQLELSSDSAPTAYEPFIGPGPYKITTPDATYELTLPSALHGIDGVRDRVVVDYVSKRGWLDGRCNIYECTGTEGWITSTLQNNPPYVRYDLNSSNLPKPLPKPNNTVCLSTHFVYKVNAPVAMWVFGTDVAYCHLRISGDFPTVDDLKSFLAAQYDAGTPVTVVYQLAEPTQTPLTLTPVDSSTAPELPREFLADATEVSPELPATIISAQPVLESRGRNLFDAADFKDYLTSLQPLIIAEGPDGSFTIRPYEHIASDSKYMQGKFKPNTRYTLSVDMKALVDAPQSTQYYIFQYTDGSFSSISNLGMEWNRYTLVSSANKTIDYIQIKWNYGRLTANKNLSLHIGSSSNTYTPYRAPTTLEFPELRAIALPETAAEWTYIRDGVKYWADTAVYAGGGWWDVVRRNGAYVYNGTENFQIGTDNLNDVYRYYTPTAPLATSSNALPGYCTHLKTLTNKNQNEQGVLFGYSNSNIYLYLNKTQFPTKESVNSFLSSQHDAGTPVTVLYQLAEPTTERVQLGTLTSFPRYTHVEQIDNGLPIRMELDSRVIDRKEI